MRTQNFVAATAISVGVNAYFSLTDPSERISLFLGRVTMLKGQTNSFAPVCRHLYNGAPCLTQPLASRFVKMFECLD